MKKYLLILIVVLTKTCFGNPMIYALHINGISTSITEAQDNLEQLTALQVTKTNLVKWRLLYNQTDGLWDDLSTIFTRNITFMTLPNFNQSLQIHWHE